MNEPMLVGRTIRDDKADTITYEDKYEVRFNDDIAVFEGTYTQCLTFIGARVLGKTFLVAQRFARGIYV